MWKGNVGLCFVSNFFAYLNNKGILIDIPHLLYRILYICCKMSEKMPFFNKVLTWTINQMLYMFCYILISWNYQGFPVSIVYIVFNGWIYITLVIWDAYNISIASKIYITTGLIISLHISSVVSMYIPWSNEHSMCLILLLAFIYFASFEYEIKDQTSMIPKVL